VATDVIAHRGASAYAPENTLAAFSLANEMGADWFELDCHLTSDNEVVVIHDGDTERTTGVTGKIAELPLAEVQVLDAGTWFSEEFSGEAIPTLAQSLEQARDNIGIYIEIKSAIDDRPLFEQLLTIMGDAPRMTPELRSELLAAIEAGGMANLVLARRVVEVVRELKMEHQVVLQSFSPSICLAVISEAPDLRVEFLGCDDEDVPTYWPAYVYFGMFIDADGFNVRHADLTPERLAYFQSHGKSVAVWTVDEPERMRELAAWGVNAIITNKPDLCLSILEEMGRRLTPPTGRPTSPMPDADAA
jgi:glycerophosphoryl diester phosphodiesterase